MGTDGQMLFTGFCETFPFEKHGINGISFAPKQILLIFNTQESMDAFKESEYAGIPIQKGVGKGATALSDMESRWYGEERCTPAMAGIEA
jgi:hypothetical protein